MSAVADELEVYHSFEECPVDGTGQGEGDVGNDWLLAEAPWANPAAPPLSPFAEADLRKKLEKLSVVRFSVLTPEQARKRVVPHPRDLHLGSVGWDVLALQRALADAGLRRWGTFTRVYGTGTRQEVRKFQRLHGLKQDGEYGPATHAKMAPHYDAHGIQLLNRVHVRTPAEIRKANLLAAAMTLYNRRGIVHYTQGAARMMIVRHRLLLAQLASMPYDYEDCSSCVTGLRYVAKLSDPNGMGFNGYGFTGTIAEHGHSISSSNAKVGDFYLYGHFPYYHVTMNVAPSRCFSHGGEGGPNLESPSYAVIGNVRRYDGLP